VLPTVSLLLLVPVVALGQATPAPPQPAPTSNAAAQAPSTPATPAPFTAGWQNGFALQTQNGDYRLQLGGLGQTDGRFSTDSPLPITNTFTIRKLRPILSGRLAKYFEFRMMPDFGSGQAAIADAYLDVRFSPAFRVRSGKDKTPVGYELLLGDATLLFPERSLVSSLMPNRDVGIQVLGDVAGGKVSYAGGVFNGVPDGANVLTEVDTNSDKDFAGRLVVQPWRSSVAASAGPLDGLGVHIGGSHGTQSGVLLPVYRTSVGQPYFSYLASAAPAGKRTRVSPAVFYYFKRAGAFAEYVRTTQVIARAGVTSDITNAAWDVSGLFNLTGEHASSGTVTPGRPFDPASGTWGALQLVARYARLSVDDRAFSDGLAAANASQTATQITVGANWYPVAFIKYYATFERTTFEGGNVSRPAEHVVLFRIQFSF